MTAEVKVFKQWKNRSRGLTARPVLPNREYAYLDDIIAVNYSIHNVTDGGAPVTGSLNPADVLFNALQPWDVDSIGYTFHWSVPGTLWPLAGKKYRTVVSLQTTIALGSLLFDMVWEAQTKDPSNL